jgi:magnesium-transporting ATPase (P-type)
MIPALALGKELPEPGIMDHPPRQLSEHVVTGSVLRRAYVWLGIPQGFAAMAAFYFMYWMNGYWGQWIGLPSTGKLYLAATAMTLASVVATQIGNVFAQRTERSSIFHINLFSNRLIWAGIVTELTLVALVIYVPFLQGVFGTAAFPVQYWLFLFAWTPLLIIVDEIRKYFVRRREQRTVRRSA